MTEKMKEHTSIPNWMLSVVVLVVISLFSAGWVKVDNLSEKVIKTEEAIKYRTYQMDRVDKKLDEILTRLRNLEME